MHKREEDLKRGCKGWRTTRRFPPEASQKTEMRFSPSTSIPKSNGDNLFSSPSSFCFGMEGIISGTKPPRIILMSCAKSTINTGKHGTIFLFLPFA